MGAQATIHGHNKVATRGREFDLKCLRCFFLKQRGAQQSAVVSAGCARSSLLRRQLAFGAEAALGFAGACAGVCGGSLYAESEQSLIRAKTASFLISLSSRPDHVSFLEFVGHFFGAESSSRLTRSTSVMTRRVFFSENLLYVTLGIAFFAIGPR